MGAVSLVNNAEMIFSKGDGENADLSVADFIKAMLDFRGTNTATVKDMVELRKFISDNLLAEIRAIHDDEKKTSACVEGLRTSLQRSAVLYNNEALCSPENNAGRGSGNAGQQEGSPRGWIERKFESLA